MIWTHFIDTATYNNVQPCDIQWQRGMIHAFALQFPGNLRKGNLRKQHRDAHHHTAALRAAQPGGSHSKLHGCPPVRDEQAMLQIFAQHCPLSYGCDRGLGGRKYSTFIAWSRRVSSFCVNPLDQNCSVVTKVPVNAQLAAIPASRNAHNTQYTTMPDFSWISSAPTINALEISITPIHPVLMNNIKKAANAPALRSPMQLSSQSQW